MSFLDSIAWQSPQPGDVAQEGDFVRFEPFVNDPLRSTPVTGMLELDQDTSGGNRRWTILYANEVADRLCARRYSTDGRLVLVGRYPREEVKEPPPAPRPQPRSLPPVPDGVFGLSWEQIERMQGGRIRRDQ